MEENSVSDFFQSFLKSSVADIINVIIATLALIGFIMAERQNLFKKRKSADKIEVVSYKEKMGHLVSNLSSATSEVDKILEEMEVAAQNREESLKILETKLSELTKREEEMKSKIESLEKIPLPAIEHFLQETEKSERRSAARDYILFTAGILASAAFSIFLKIVFNI